MQKPNKDLNHIAKITATAHQRVDLIFRTFVSRDITMLLRAYTRGLLTFGLNLNTILLFGRLH